MNELGDITIIEKILLAAGMVIFNLAGICIFVLPIAAFFRQRKKNKHTIEKLEKLD
ncbi:MAG: hypothetical protein JXN65_03565 [Clostridia bacterium]|nr:hypothetical protein [Clostridia bacterium]